MALDHYSALDLKPGASLAEVQRAYRRKAKTLHPDTSGSVGSTHEFLRLQEAYRILRDARRRLEYDASRAAPPRTNVAFPKFGGRPETRPFMCDFCRKQTAQPRYTIYWSVISNLVYAIRSPRMGMFCASCARKSALRATLVSSCFGWWSVPGLIYTPLAIFSNANGGERPRGTDGRLLWNSALLFYAKGDARLAKGLAKQVVRSGDLHSAFARNMVMCLDYICPNERGLVKDAWGSQQRDRWKHLALGLAAPLAAVAAVGASDLQIAAATPKIIEFLSSLPIRFL